jgi:hypothetical protein
MALTDENGSNGMIMPVAPMYGGNGGFGNGFGGDWAWIILLLLLGWGNNGWGDSIGRYSGDEEMISELRELMEDAPNEKVKMEFQRFIQKVESM